jgi:transposase-like protein
MTVMTAQAPLPLIPAEARCIGDAVGLVEDAEGGRVFIHGSLAYTWKAGDEAGRRLAAVQLVEIKAATQAAVAAGFGTDPSTLWRWAKRLQAHGVSGLGSAARGPKGPSKLTLELATDIRTRVGAGSSLRSIARSLGVSLDTVRRARGEIRDESDEQDGAADCGNEAGQAEAETDGGADERGGDAGDVAAAEDGDRLPVLADPPDRDVERVLARFRLIDHAYPVFTPAARVPLAGLFLALPGLEATGLLACAGEVYQVLPRGFYGLETVLVEAVLRALAGEPRAEGATRIDPVALGRVLGLDRGGYS